MKKFLIFILLIFPPGIFGVFILSLITDQSIQCILGKAEVLSVLIVAFPTLIIWYWEIESKKYENRHCAIENFLKLQNNLEEKYNRLLHSKNDQFPEDKNNQLLFEKKYIQDVTNFLDILENNKKMLLDSKNNFYGLDLSILYDKLSELKGDEEISKRVGKLNERIIYYWYGNFRGKKLDDKFRFFTGKDTFSYIDFSKIMLHNYIDKENSHECITFKTCIIDIDNFKFLFLGGKNKIKEISFENCQFVSQYLKSKKSISEIELKKTIQGGEEIENIYIKKG